MTTPITAAPVVRKPIASMHKHAPGYTDFVRIYIASELNRAEYRTTLRHEQAHVWARHNMRVPPDARADEWMIACEMEIARSIYDDADLATITAPRSRLNGAYLPDTIPDMPADLLLAEDIYQWLVDHPHESPEQSSCGCGCTHTEPDATDDGAPAPMSIGDIRAEMDAQEGRQRAAAVALADYAELLHRRPSLTEAIDAHLRVRVERESSYRRPSRRDVPGAILRGRRTEPRPPRVEIFVDRSGSFDEAKTASAEQSLSTILARYGASIRSDVWFFGAGELRARDSRHGGDTPYPLIAEHLLRSRPKLAIVITDDDQCGPLPSIPHGTHILCMPIGCTHTAFAPAIGAVEVRP